MSHLKVQRCCRVIHGSRLRDSCQFVDWMRVLSFSTVIWGLEWRLQLQPSCIHSSRQEGGGKGRMSPFKDTPFLLISH